MTKHKADVGIWMPAPAPPISVPRSSSRLLHISPRVLGFCGTLLLHALALHSGLWGTRAIKFHVPETQGLGATLIKSAIVPSETLVLVDIPQASMADRPLDEVLASAGLQPKNDLATFISTDPLPHVDIPDDKVSDDKDASTAIDSGDPAQRAALFGRYTGQIDARIERVWRRPRSPVNANSGALGCAESSGARATDQFSCQVRIVQDGHGSVQEVQMLECNGRGAWQQSLVAAIFSSSPMPAPPDPKVFSRSLTMTFTAAPYSQGRSVDEYELERESICVATSNGGTVERH